MSPAPLTNVENMLIIAAKAVWLDIREHVGDTETEWDDLGPLTRIRIMEIVVPAVLALNEAGYLKTT